MGDFTKGPWIVVDDDLNEPWKMDVCTADERVMIANVRVAPPTGETSANAHLIAAAPELLEALQNLSDAAALVIERWEKGDLAEAMRLLAADLGNARQAVGKAVRP